MRLQCKKSALVFGSPCVLCAWSTLFTRETVKHSGERSVLTRRWINVHKESRGSGCVCWGSVPISGPAGTGEVLSADRLCSPLTGSIQELKRRSASPD